MDKVYCLKVTFVVVEGVIIDCKSEYQVADGTTRSEFSGKKKCCYPQINYLKIPGEKKRLKNPAIFKRAFFFACLGPLNKN